MYNHLDDIGKGWHGIVQPLLDYCEKHNIEVMQVKEKFGTLRFYSRPWQSDGPFETMVSEAESRSERTCEWCGAEGKRRPGGWIKTLCDEHAIRWDKGERW